VKAGTPICRFDPRIDRLIPPDEVAGLPPVGQEFLRTYTYQAPEIGGGQVLNGDNARFHSHSRQPYTDNSGPVTTPAPTAQAHDLPLDSACDRTNQPLGDWRRVTVHTEGDKKFIAWVASQKAPDGSHLTPFFELLDRKLAGVELDTGDEAFAWLSRPEQEMVEDTFRVLSISFSYMDGAESIAEFMEAHRERDVLGLIQGINRIISAELDREKLV